MSKAPLENVISTKSATMNNQLYNSTATAQLGSHEITKDALKDCLIQVLNSHPCMDAKILKSKNYKYFQGWRTRGGRGGPGPP